MLPALFVLAQVDATDPAAELFKQLPCVNKEPDSKTLYFAGTDTPSGHADSDCYGFLAGPGGTAFCGLLDFGTGASAQSPNDMCCQCGGGLYDTQQIDCDLWLTFDDVECTCDPRKSAIIATNCRATCGCGPQPPPPLPPSPPPSVPVGTEGCRNKELPPNPHLHYRKRVKGWGPNHVTCTFFDEAPWECDEYMWSVQPGM